MTQTLERQRARQCTRIPDFKPVGEQANFDGSIAVVIAVGDGIYDGLVNGVRGQFVM